MTTQAEILKNARKAMAKALENTKRELATIRTGRATTALLDVVRVDAYGQKMALNQVANVAAPEAQLLSIQPYDLSLIGEIERALLESDLGLTPANDGTIIRLPIPPITEERRKELVKVVHKLAEEGRVAIRHVRHEALAQVKKLEHVAKDDKKRDEKEVQKLTDELVKDVDRLVDAKEAEVLEV